MPAQYSFIGSPDTRESPSRYRRCPQIDASVSGRVSCRSSCTSKNLPSWSVSRHLSPFSSQHVQGSKSCNRIIDMWRLLEQIGRSCPAQRGRVAASAVRTGNVQVSSILPAKVAPHRTSNRRRNPAPLSHDRGGSLCLLLALCRTSPSLTDQTPPVFVRSAIRPKIGFMYVDPPG